MQVYIFIYPNCGIIVSTLGVIDFG